MTSQIEHASRPVGSHGDAVDGVLRNFVFEEGRRLAGIDTQALGFNERWLASVGVFTVEDGFGEEAWIDAGPVTVLASRLRGAPVVCRHGAGTEGRICAGSSLALQPRGTPNHYTADGPIRFAQIYLHDRLIDRVADSLRPGSSASGLLRDDLIFFPDRVLETLVESYLRAAVRPESSLELEARAILLVSRILREHHSFGDAAEKRASGGLAPWQLKRACDAMTAQLDGELGLDELAAVVGCSPTHFSRAFKQSTGLAPFRWLAERRIEKAKALLEKTRLPLAEIALAVGFSAQPQFTTAFGRSTGVAPGQWRRERLS